eukprot:1147842-Pelagomonas_calceolata.AAC.2
MHVSQHIAIHSLDVPGAQAPWHSRKNQFGTAMDSTGGCMAWNSEQIWQILTYIPLACRSEKTRTWKRCARTPSSRLPLTSMTSLSSTGMRSRRHLVSLGRRKTTSNGGSQAASVVNDRHFICTGAGSCYVTSHARERCTNNRPAVFNAFCLGAAAARSCVPELADICMNHTDCSDFLFPPATASIIVYNGKCNLSLRLAAIGEQRPPLTASRERTGNCSAAATMLH